MGRASGRRRMINSVNKLTAENDCTEAILIQRRPKWIALSTGVAMLTGNVGVMLLPMPDELEPFVGVELALFVRNTLALFVGMALAMVVFLSLTSYLVLAHRPGEVVLARSSRWYAKAVEIADRWPSPVSAPIDSTIMSKRVTLGSSQYHVPPQFSRRLNKILSSK